MRLEMVRTGLSGAVAVMAFAGCATFLGFDEDYHPVGEGGSAGTGGGTGGGTATGGGGAAGNTGGGCRAGECASCAGLPANCGPDSNESCCATLDVPGGTYLRSDLGTAEATVSDFRLDKFEVTVGRFRAFFAAYPGSKPADGAGEHSKISGSGWSNAKWNGALEATQAELEMGLLSCPIPVWTGKAGSSERLPMNCVTWYEAFAFCAWDGGRLPTEAEWNYAAAGGDEQRVYPWSQPPGDMTINEETYAVYQCPQSGCTLDDLANVGSRPMGNGKWGQADLAGNVQEWNLDWFNEPYLSPCDGCADLQTGTVRITRGGSFNSSYDNLTTFKRTDKDPSMRDYRIGIRCARTP